MTAAEDKRARAEKVLNAASPASNPAARGKATSNPGHGFPNDVVSFLPGNQFKQEQNDAPDGHRYRTALGPQRSLDLAIRDYAPGSEVVLDGLVYKSAGVTLNWKRPASEENLADIQSLRFHWRCVECGASDTRRGGKPDYCSVCGATNLLAAEFLRPAGFSVDPRERAHAETDTPTYVPPEDPIASTRGAPWRSLPIPEMGRYRCSREGLVYYSNRGGPNGHGYAICLGVLPLGWTDCLEELTGLAGVSK